MLHAETDRQSKSVRDLLSGRAEAYPTAAAGSVCDHSLMRLPTARSRVWPVRRSVHAMAPVRSFLASSATMRSARFDFPSEEEIELTSSSAASGVSWSRGGLKKAQAWF